MNLDWNSLPGLIAVVISAGFMIYVQFFKKKDELTAQTDEAESRVIRLLQANVQALELKVSELEKKVLEYVQDNAKLRSERDTMASILTGRDERSIEMVKASQIAMQKIDTIDERTKRMEEKLMGLSNYTKP